MNESKKRENRVHFQGEFSKPPKVFQGQDEKRGPMIKLFLKGDTREGSVFMPVRITGDIAEKLVDKVDHWQIGDEIVVDGELDWESFEKDGKKQYSTRINAFQIRRIEGA
jgi:hypothetical protein